MKYAYPAIFAKDDEGYTTVDFPDIESCYTFGDDMEDALFMAEDVLNLVLWRKEEKGEAIPPASEASAVKCNDGETVVLIKADTEAYARMMERENDTEEITVAVPRWICESARREEVDFASVFRRALVACLGTAAR